MDSLSFADGHTLSLIAQYPDDNWATVIPDLSEEAQKLAQAIIRPDNAKGELKSAAEHLRQLADRARNAHA